MSTKPTKPADLFTHAPRHLSRRCAVMKSIIKGVGPCTLTPKTDDPFTLIVNCVISQQISTKAAASIAAKLVAAVKGPPVRRDRLAKLTDEQFRACGISGPKQRTLRAVLDHVAANPDLLPGIHDRDDAAIREQLTAIKGIGPWTVDMFLMFAISRPDVLPVGDLGLRAGVKRFYGLAGLPTVAELEAIAEKWKPYRTVGTWYIWQGLKLPISDSR
jgi:DNA-3-methyladenine glycosylase II